MPWQFKPKKDVAANDMLRRGGKQPLTRRFPNGATYMLEEHVSFRRGVGIDGIPREVKHLSNARKRKKAFTKVNFSTKYEYERITNS